MLRNSVRYSDTANSCTSGNWDLGCWRVFIKAALSPVCIAVLMDVTARDSVDRLLQMITLVFDFSKGQICRYSCCKSECLHYFDQGIAQGLTWCLERAYKAFGDTFALNNNYGIYLLSQEIFLVDDISGPSVKTKWRKQLSLRPVSAYNMYAHIYIQTWPTVGLSIKNIALTNCTIKIIQTKVVQTVHYEVGASQVCEKMKILWGL